MKEVLVIYKDSILGICYSILKLKYEKFSSFIIRIERYRTCSNVWNIEHRVLLIMLQHRHCIGVKFDVCCAISKLLMRN